jgi:hypothetical protein
VKCESRWVDVYQLPTIRSIGGAGASSSRYSACQTCPRRDFPPEIAARHAIILVPRRLDRFAVHRQWLRRHRGAEPDVGQPRPTVQRHQHRLVRARGRRRIVRQHPAHPAQHRLGLEPDRLQHAQEQAVLFETITAAPPIDQLRFDRGVVDRDPHASQRVDRLERDRGDMRRLQRGEHFRSGRHRPGIADPRQIARQERRPFGGRRIAVVGAGCGGSGIVQHRQGLHSRINCQAL